MGGVRAMVVGVVVVGGKGWRYNYVGGESWREWNRGEISPGENFRLGEDE